MFSFLGDEGIGEAIVPAANQTDPSRYPTSMRVISRLRACVPLGNSAAVGGTTFTLYKNGVATAMTCNIPASSGAGTKAVDEAHPIVFADGDDFDVRVDSATIAAALAVSATLEGP